MNIMGIVIVAGLVLVFGALISAVLVLLYKEGLIEVSPKRAVVYKNIWTGKPEALLAGMHQIIPGIHKKLLEVTLENEPSDPEVVKVITADGIQISVDVVIYTQQVGVENEEVKGEEKEEVLKVAIVKAATVIDYKNRRSLIWDRIKAHLQYVIAGIQMDDIFSKNKTNQKIIDEAESYINDQLKQKVGEEWGIQVEARVEGMKPPEKLLEVAEEVATAEKEGIKIKQKADAAHVDPRLVMIGDIAYDIARAFGSFFGGGRK